MSFSCFVPETERFYAVTMRDSEINIVFRYKLTSWIPFDRYNLAKFKLYLYFVLIDEEKVSH